MRFRRVLLARAAIGDVGVSDDQGWLRRLSLSRMQSGVNRCDIVAITDLLYMPAVGVEALAHLFGEGAIGGAVDRDVVVVIEVDQLSELQMSG
jgi:hypothetical protein